MSLTTTHVMFPAGDMKSLKPKLVGGYRFEFNHRTFFIYEGEFCGEARLRLALVPIGFTVVTLPLSFKLDMDETHLIGEACRLLSRIYEKSGDAAFNKILDAMSHI